MRCNQKKPDIVVSDKTQGGIVIHSTIKLNHISESVIKSIASEFLINADITIREDINEDQLIDFSERFHVLGESLKDDYPSLMDKLFNNLKEIYSKVNSTF